MTSSNGEVQECLLLLGLRLKTLVKQGCKVVYLAQITLCGGVEKFFWVGYAVVEANKLTEAFDHMIVAVQCPKVAMDQKCIDCLRSCYQASEDLCCVVIGGVAHGAVVVLVTGVAAQLHGMGEVVYKGEVLLVNGLYEGLRAMLLV